MYDYSKYGIDESKIKTFNGKTHYMSNINWSYMNLTQIPIHFDVVVGSFNISNNQIASLYNLPEIVKGSLDCSNNQLKTFEHISLVIDFHLDAANNQIENLKFLQNTKCRSINLQNNKLLYLPNISSVVEPVVTGNPILLIDDGVLSNTENIIKENLENIKLIDFSKYTTETIEELYTQLRKTNSKIFEIIETKIYTENVKGLREDKYIRTRQKTQKNIGFAF